MFDANKNYQKTKEKIGYKPLSKMTQKDYEDMGFKCGLEVHQQLKTQKKLFCRCPAGYYQKAHDYDAEVIRHMRPTLSELGEYDGTALMEFRTRKNITYRIKYKTACTYDIDDTPPFYINEEALKIALEISLLLKQNIVGELHITRKQYLDGSIPTGFQRTGIIGVAGEFPISNKIIKLIQLSIEEDACREVSDIGHERIYMTDRLGMPLIETVTEPNLLTPYEAAEAGHYIRFLARSTGKVRTGHGASRQDVNVSVTGGQRVEIKGVGRIALIPKLTHNEAFRQKGLLAVKEELIKRFDDPINWKLSFHKLNPIEFKHTYKNIEKQLGSLNELNKGVLLAINLPGYKGLLSQFTGPMRMFADEISDRLKVIACLEKPNMLHSEMLTDDFCSDEWKKVASELKAGENDAQIILLAPEADVKTAIETISERFQIAFNGVPDETRKPRKDGTTYFERVLPGPDRMYPDTDTAPIPISEKLIEELQNNLPVTVSEQLALLNEWQVPQDTQHFILRKNLMPLFKRIVVDFDESPKFVASILGHTLKHLQGQIKPTTDFNEQKLYDVFAFVKKEKLSKEIIKEMLPVIYEHPQIELESVLEIIGYQKSDLEQLKKDVPTLLQKFDEIKTTKREHANIDWVMGHLRKQVLGQMPLSELKKWVEEAKS